MRAIEINQELGSVKEKFYGFEMYQILYAGLAGMLSLYLNFRLPQSLGELRGIIASMVTVPIILIAIKDFYGLKVLDLQRRFSDPCLIINHLCLNQKPYGRGLNENANSKEKKLYRE